MADECWDLRPPDWFNREWLKTPKSTKLFEKYLGNAPDGLVPEKPATSQGTYSMTAEGDYLAGAFARVNRKQTIVLLEKALGEFQKRGEAMKPVPENKLPFYMGEEPRKGWLKLQLGYRDLPRGENRLVQAKWMERPVNLGFLDLKPEEVASFRVGEGENKTLPESLVKKISQQALKDSARGQCNVVKKSFQGGEWTVREISREGDKQLLELRGKSRLEGKGRTFEPAVFGRLEYDLGKERFTRFDVVAVGQRRGAAKHNFRDQDRDAAPLGVAIRLFAE